MKTTRSKSVPTYTTHNKGRPKSGIKKKLGGAYIEVQLYEKIDEIAVKENRSFSEQVRHILLQWLEAYKKNV